MKKTCFVIMGFNTKRIPNTRKMIDLNLVYETIIKPTIIKSNLSSLYGENIFRADEVNTSQRIDRTFIEGIFKADIVIADITTLNQNAIYELGLRHAMKPKSTIILCDNHTSKLNFFDISHLPQIRYDSDNLENPKKIQETQQKILDCIHTAISSNEQFIDSPIFELNLYRIIENNNKVDSEIFSSESESISLLLMKANGLKNDENYEEASKIYEKILEKKIYDEDILAGYLLCLYKKDEFSIINLKTAQLTLAKYLDISTTTFSKILGIYGAIFLRMFYITKEKKDLLDAINYYRLGMNFDDENIYCARNYCANLLKIGEIETDIEIIKEFFYTARYTAKIILGSLSNSNRKTSQIDDLWYISNQQDLLFIAGMIDEIKNITGLHTRQSNTIQKGKKMLIEDMKKIQQKINF